MNISTEQVFINALSLPASERALLVHKLLLSLQPEQQSGDIEAAWVAESLDRCKAYDDGQIIERDSTDVLDSARKKLSEDV